MANEPRLAVAVLEVMWDWEARTSSAGYIDHAPTWFRINPHNHTGGRLYDWIGAKGEHYDELLVTNACKELVDSAKGRGKPDPKWLQENLLQLYPFDLLLVCGKVAKATYDFAYWKGKARIIETPHPAARLWSTASLERMRTIVQRGKISCNINFRRDGSPIFHPL